MRSLAALMVAGIAAQGVGAAQTPPEVPRLRAEVVREYTAPEADQGAAVDSMHFYAIDNFVIAKYRKADGALVARFEGERGGPIRHMNSCFADADQLLCANSNYSETPMASSIEVFDAASLRHIGSHSLGIMDEGSLTWFDRVEGGYIAAFAHYDGTDGGLAFKDHRFTGLVAFDGQWRRRGGWMFPDSVLERLAPDSASGGQIGPDGLLYVLGHDRPELYVLAKPTMGPKLIHLATIDLPVEGQAFSWDHAAPMRLIYAVDRRKGLVRVVAPPTVTIDHPYAARFR